MNGSIEERKGPRGTAWRLRVNNGSDSATGRPNVIRRTIPASRHLGKREAQRELRKLISEIENGGYVEPTTDTVGDMLNLWLDTIEAAASVRPKTLESYRLICDSYLRPFLGHIPIPKISPVAIDRAYKELRKKASNRGGVISPRTVSHAHRTLSESFRWGVSRGLAQSNPCDLVNTPKFPKPEIRLIEPEEMSQILDYLQLHSEWAVAPSILALTTGARRSELLGLRWADVQLDSGQLSIQRGLSQLRDQSTQIQPTKTVKSNRRVALTAVAIKTLQSWKSTQEGKAKSIGLSLRASDPVFSDPPVNAGVDRWRSYLPSSLSQAFSRACKHLNLHAVSFKSLRHTHASTLLKLNIHPKVVQERLGHSTVTTTLDVYSHVMPGLQQAAAEAFDQAFTSDKLTADQTELP